ncbi:MAG: ATP phosphoribosyltransferase [Gammaproteobacteria bacterium]
MDTPSAQSKSLVIAVSKGRILDQALPLLEEAGIVPSEDPDVSRKLILDTDEENIKLVIIRAADVPTFVEYGAADLGIAGKDVLLEYEGDGFYEPLDLKIAACRLMLAGRGEVDNNARRLRVATKYAATARQYFADKGVQIEIVKLYGSMELAPLVGLADYIVDLVDTGNTLKANGLVPMDHICDVTSRLIVNKAAMKMKHARITNLIERLRSVVE